MTLARSERADARHPLVRPEWVNAWPLRNWQDLKQRVLTRLFFVKFFGIPAVTALFFVGYIYLLRNPRGDTYTMPTLWLDDVITVQPWSLVFYFSLWVYVSLPPLFARQFSELIGYGWRVGLLCIVCLVIFYIWPNAVPPAHVDWARYPGMAFLKGVDAAGNACPSLHVATALLAAMWLHRVLPPGRLLFSWRGANIAWGVLIVYSTLATKQHVAVDAIAGVAVTLLIAWITAPWLLLSQPHLPEEMHL